MASILYNKTEGARKWNIGQDLRNSFKFQQLHLILHYSNIFNVVWNRMEGMTE